MIDNEITLIRNTSDANSPVNDVFLGTDQSMAISINLTMVKAKYLFCLADGSYKDRKGLVHKFRQLQGYDFETKDMGPVGDYEDLYNRVMNQFYNSNLNITMER